MVANCLRGFFVDMFSESFCPREVKSQGFSSFCLIWNLNCISDLITNFTAKFGHSKVAVKIYERPQKLITYKLARSRMSSAGHPTRRRSRRHLLVRWHHRRTVPTGLRPFWHCQQHLWWGRHFRSHRRRVHPRYVGYVRVNRSQKSWKYTKEKCWKIKPFYALEQWFPTFF